MFWDFDKQGQDSLSWYYDIEIHILKGDLGLSKRNVISFQVDYSEKLKKNFCENLINMNFSVKINPLVIT